MIHGASVDGATATSNIAMEHRHGNKTDNTTTQSPVESDAYTLQDDDPLSLPSERLLPDQSNRNKLTPQNIALIKSSAINLLWILTWYDLLLGNVFYLFFFFPFFFLTF